MTNYEIDKKKMNQEELLNDVAEKRSNLTMILLDLMDQQVVKIDFRYVSTYYLQHLLLCICVGKTKESIASNIGRHGEPKDRQ